MNGFTLDDASKLFAHTAMQGAADYIHEHGLSAKGREHELVYAIRRHSKAAADRAIANDHELHEALVDDVAAATVKAAMRAAGVEAAKEVLG